MCPGCAAARRAKKCARPRRVEEKTARRRGGGVTSRARPVRTCRGKGSYRIVWSRARLRSDRAMRVTLAGGSGLPRADIQRRAHRVEAAGAENNFLVRVRVHSGHQCPVRRRCQASRAHLRRGACADRPIAVSPACRSLRAGDPTRARSDGEAMANDERSGREPTATSPRSSFS